MNRYSLEKYQKICNMSTKKKYLEQADIVKNNYNAANIR